MCGRYTLKTPAAEVAAIFDLAEVPALPPRFNIAPTQGVLAVRWRLPGRHREPASLRWGLVPGWAKDLSIGARMINARAETAFEKPAFRAAMRARRCLVAADGFFEWRKDGARKQPIYYTMQDGRPFAFAGCWERWQGPDGAAVETCTILTTAANALLAGVHDRMPVVLSPADFDAWLDPATPDPARALGPLLRPFPADVMRATPVGPRVNSPRNDDAGCIAPALEGA